MAANGDVIKYGCRRVTIVTVHREWLGLEKWTLPEPKIGGREPLIIN